MAVKSDNTGYETLRARIKNNDVSGAFVFYGEETYLRERAIDEIRALTVPPAAESFNLNIFDSSFRTEELAQAVNSLPMLCEHRLVIVKDLDLYRLQEAEQKIIVSVLEDIPDYCTLIFIYDTLAYKTDARKKIHGIIKKYALTVEFALNEAAKLTSWIQRHFRSEGLSISSQDAQYLVFVVGRQMTALLGEIGKLSAYAKNGTVTKEDIDAAVIPGIEAEAFSLVRFICKGEYEKAFETLEKLFELHTDALAILGAMGWQLRRIYTACLVRRSGGGEKKLVQLCPGMNSYSARMNLQLASSISVRWCRSAVKLCAQADLDSKSSAGDSAEIFETLVLRLIQEKSAHV